MANKQALRDLQTRLADRLQAARTEPLGRSWLAVECSSRGFLVSLGRRGGALPTVPRARLPVSAARRRRDLPDGAAPARTAQPPLVPRRCQPARPPARRRRPG